MVLVDEICECRSVVTACSEGCSISQIVTAKPLYSAFGCDFSKCIGTFPPSSDTSTILVAICPLLIGRDPLFQHKLLWLPKIKAT